MGFPASQMASAPVVYCTLVESLQSLHRVLQSLQVTKPFFEAAYWPIAWVCDEL